MTTLQHLAPEPAVPVGDTTPPLDRGERRCRIGPLTIRWDPRVLEPRPWSFEQSRWAVEVARDAGPGPLVELCSGAGHIGLAAALLSGRRLVQVDASAAACELARLNAAAAGLAGSTEVVCGDLATAALPSGVPIVIADPPYLPSSEVDAFPDDPVLAVDGGDDGLELIRACVRTAERILAPSGTLLLQVWGEAQAQEVEREVSTTLTPTDVRVFGPTRALMRFDADRRRHG